MARQGPLLTPTSPRLSDSGSFTRTHSDSDPIPRLNTDGSASRLDRKPFSFHRRNRAEEDASEERLKDLWRLQRLLMVRETQADCALQQIDQLKEAHAEEQQALRRENAQLTDRLRILGQKLERLPALEGYVVDMLLEFMISPEDDTTAEETARILAKAKSVAAERSPLENLDRLRGVLRSQLSRRNDGEHRLQRQVLALREQLSALTDQHATLAESHAALLAASQAAPEQVVRADTAADVPRLELRDEFEAQLAVAQRETADMEAKLREEQQQTQQLELIIAQRDALLREKEAQLLQLHALEQRGEREAQRHAREMEALQSAVRRSARRLEKAEALHVKRQHEVDALRVELSHARQQTGDLRSALSWQHITDMRKRLTDLEAKYEAAAARNAALEAQLRGPSRVRPQTADTRRPSAPFPALDATARTPGSKVVMSTPRPG